MSSRFKRIFMLRKNLYLENSPLVIAAGALSLDQETNTPIVQLKFKNITEQVVKSVKVRIIQKDTANRVLGDPVLFEYLDLCEYRDKEFGSKTPVPLPEASARSFDVHILEVVFESGEMWTYQETQWSPLTEQKPLYLEDYELKKQFNMEVSSAAIYEVLDVKDLWICSCGAINHNDELKCHNCSVEYDQLKNVNIELLRQHKEERLAKEAEEREQARIEREAIQAEKSRKVKIIAPFVIAVAIILIAISVIYSKVIKPRNAYNKAVNELNEGKFEEALKHFKELGDYKDSANQLDLYNEYFNAISLASNYQTEEALEFFEKHKDYIDSEAWITLAHAIKKGNKKSYEEAYEEISKIDISQFKNEYGTSLYQEWYATITIMYIYKSPKYSVKEAYDTISSIKSEYSDTSVAVKSLRPLAECDGTFTCTDKNGAKHEITITHWMHEGGSYTLEIKNDFENLEFNVEPTVLIGNDNIHDYRVYAVGKINGKEQVFYIAYNTKELVIDGGSKGETRLDRDGKSYKNSTDFGVYTLTR